MNICHVWDADYPWDVRVEKVCLSLQKRHEVHLVCRNNQRGPVFEVLDGLHIHRLPSLPAVFGRLNSIAGFPAFLNPLWLYRIWQVVRKTRAELILVRDLPLALSAVIVGRLARVPVVLDMAENYPAMMEDLWAMTPLGVQTVINAFVRNPAIVRAIEKIAIRSVEHILVVVEEARDRLVRLGVPESRISLVINTPTLERLSNTSDGQGEVAVPGNGAEKLTLIYLGLLESPRGLDTAIGGMARLRDQRVDVRLQIVGSGRDSERLHAMVEEADLGDRVQFLGWIDYKDAIQYIKTADIGLVPHHATASWNSTIPNKLFDYMSMGKPVIVSDAIPAKRVVNEEGCGAVFQDRNADDFARAVRALTSENVRRACGQRGREAIARRYNWQNDEERLLSAVEQVVAAGGRS